MVGSFVFFLLICALFGVAAGLQGRAKGSSFLLWFVIGAFLPLFGFLASIAYQGRSDDLRRRCGGCGRMLPISDTTCMRCGTDQDFPDQAYLPAALRPVAPPPGDDGRPAAR